SIRMISDRRSGAVAMGRFSGRFAVVIPFASLIAACATSAPPQRPPMVSSAPPRTAPTPPVAQAAPPAPIPRPAYKVGSPYQVDGVWYYPQEQPGYDATGI